VVDRLIPSDDCGPGGKDAGCAVFIDGQLAGPYGRGDGLYLKPPFLRGVATQGYQMPDGPRHAIGPRLGRWPIKTTFAGKIVSAA
jgi:gluconate 2-dehydrogenase gamma chain